MRKLTNLLLVALLIGCGPRYVAEKALKMGREGKMDFNLDFERTGIYYHTRFDNVFTYTPYEDMDKAVNFIDLSRVGSFEYLGKEELPPMDYIKKRNIYTDFNFPDTGERDTAVINYLISDFNGEVKDSILTYTSESNLRRIELTYLVDLLDGNRVRYKVKLIKEPEGWKVYYALPKI